MKTKRIAQLCCAVLVAAGIGLNIQNALTNYGMNSNMLSLVATGGSGSNSGGYCQAPGLVGLDLIPSTVTFVYQTATYSDCGVKSGKWNLGYELLRRGASNDGAVFYIRLSTEDKLTYYRWHHWYEHVKTDYNPDGTVKKEWYHNWRTCQENAGTYDSSCGRALDTEDLGIS